MYHSCATYLHVLSAKRRTHKRVSWKSMCPRYNAQNSCMPAFWVWPKIHMKFTWKFMRPALILALSLICNMRVFSQLKQSGKYASNAPEPSKTCHCGIAHVCFPPFSKKSLIIYKSTISLFLRKKKHFCLFEISPEKPTAKFWWWGWCW